MALEKSIRREVLGTSGGPSGATRLWGIATLFALLPMVAMGQDETLRNPILVPGVAWAFNGFRVNVPAEDGWYSVARDAQYADLAKDLPEGTKLAAVVAARTLEAPLVGEEALLDLIRAEQSAVPEGERMKLVDYAAQPFAPKGVLCARFSVKFDDRRASFPQPGVLLVRGVSCVRPDRPDVVVTLSYAQRSALDNVPPERQQLIDNFLDSLRFLPSNAALMQQARMAVRSDPPENVVGLLTPVANDGDSEAALFLGNVYLYGRGVPPDFQAARKWLEVAAKAGQAEAAYNLGAMYDKGVGTTRDAPEAIKWFTRAADQRDAGAQLNIGLLYLTGNGIAKDIGTAEQWLKRASGNGDKRARAILAAGKYKVQ